MGDSHHELVLVSVKVYPKDKQLYDFDLAEMENTASFLWWSETKTSDILSMVDEKTRTVSCTIIKFEFDMISWDMNYIPDVAGYLHMLVEEAGVSAAFEGDDDRLAEIALRRYNDKEANFHWSVFHFIVIYDVYTGVRHTEFGKEEDVEFHFLGELDFKKLPAALVG